jgi:uncharacterized OB-fold protein
VTEPLIAPHVLEFDYTRSLGPTLTAFFTGLRDRKIVGARTRTGRVIVPPTPHDPDTGEDIDALVDVSDEGVVETWTYVAEPRPKQPLGRPFSWALITLDGADTAMLHVVDGAIATGSRVKARWRDETVGYITDIECFVPIS